jgi:hypothetical protein
MIRRLANVSTIRGLILLGLILMHAPRAHSDEGMWLFNRPPRKVLEERYGFKITDDWLAHVQKSSVRFNSGGSGSFVSAGGLVMTNHHVGADALQKLSTADRDLIQTGYYARNAKEELKCVDLELNVLVDIVDVTERVNAAVKSPDDPGAAQKERQAVMNTIEKESLDKTGLRSDVITLYQGGMYQLYRYKKFTDVRLVFAPEKDIAFFGGDPDNFEFPRYDLDCCFFRIYEDGKPAQLEHHLKWSARGVADEELIFVSGNPGKTDRQNTVTHLEFLRDLSFPISMDNIRRREINLRSYSDHSLENARRAQDELFAYQNTRKARLGGLDALQNPQVMIPKQKAELALQNKVEDDQKLADRYGDAWEQIDEALEIWSENFEDHYLLERGMAFNTHLFIIARQLVRLTDEMQKPNAKRLREFSEAGLDSLKQELFSEAPIYADLETVKLADSLSFMLEMLGTDDELVEKIMANKSPSDRAAELIAGSKLADVGFRRQLFDGGTQAIADSDDTMIQLARLVDPSSRDIRTLFDERVDEPMRQAYGKIAKARFAIEGADTYPDATFTLRLAFGQVKGYEDLGKKYPPWTTVGNIFRHAAEHGNKDPFELPESWRKKKDELMKSDTPFNFLSTADIIGGNSGSPVINRAGEVVGLIFDGNIQSLELDFAYTDEKARAISVDVRAIIEALRTVYDAVDLADELLGKKE